MPDLTIQDFEIVQENGNLVAKDGNDNTVLTYNDSAGQWEFGTVSAESVSTENLLTDSQTIYVRQTGSDENDGLSIDTPKRSIQSAINDAPIPGGDAALVIDIGSAGDVFGETVSFDKGARLSKVVLRGKTSSGSPDVTIDGAGLGGDTIFADNISIVLQDLVIQNGDEYNLHTNGNAAWRLENCTVKNGTLANAQIERGSLLNPDPSTVFDMTGVSGAFYNIGLQRNCGMWSACSVIGDGGGDSVARFAVNSFANIYEGVWKGSGTTPHILVLADGAHSKFGSNLTFEDADYIATLRKNSTLNYPNNSANFTLNNIANPTQRYEADSGSVVDDGEFGEVINSVATNQNTPQNLKSEGAHHYNASTGMLEFYDPAVRSNWLESGREVHKTESISVPANGSVSVDTGNGNNRLFMYPAIQTDSSPASDAEIDVSMFWDSANGRTEWRFTETNGTAIDLTVRFYRVGRNL